jgi:hypothetical protein
VLGETYLKLNVLVDLEELIIVGTPIAKVKTGALVGLAKLNKLDLSKNQIEAVDSDAFDEVDTVTSLDLSDNKLRILGKKTFQSLKTLVYLNLKGNKLEGLVSGIFQFQSVLIELDLQSNLLTSNGVEPDAFSFTKKGADGLRDLSILRLNDNELTGVTDVSFANLGNMTELHMSDNEMTDISTNAFNDNELLAKVYLRNNEFVTVENAVFDTMPALSSLFLAGDYWNCCDLEWIANASYIKDTTQVMCARPASASGFALVTNANRIAIDAISSAECDQDLPTTPAEPYLMTSTSTSLTVEWAVVKGNAYDVDYYIVEHKTNVWTTAVCPSGRSPPLIDAVTTTSSACRIVTDGTSSTSVYSLTVENLDKATTYEVRVTAHSVLPGAADDGGSLSEAGAFATFTTAEDTPDAVYQALATTTSAYSVMVYFSKPQSSNGVIIKYDIDINYGALDASTNIRYEMICSGTNNTNCDAITIEHKFQGLTPNTKYTVTITPWTAIQSPGVATIIQSTTDESPPNAPAAPFLQDVGGTGSTFINLQWNVSSAEDANGVITGYTVYVDPLEASVTGLGFVAAGVGTTRLIGGLSPSTQYTVTLTASTANGTTGSGGESSPSSGFLVATEQAAPGQQEPPIGITLSATSIEVTWEPPAVTNGRIIGYTFKLQPEVESESVQYINTSSAEPFVTILGLSPATGYNLSVQAFNTLARNEFSVESRVVTSQSAPTAVSVSATSISSTEIQLDWTPPESPNGAILSYEVYQISASQYVANYDPIEDKEQIALFNGTKDDLSFLHKTAKPHFTYRYSVSATNAAASSPLEKVGQATTFESIPENQYAPTVKIQGATEVMLRWSKPEKPNGEIIKYEVHINQNENESPSYSGIPEGDDITDGKLSVTLVDLAPDTTYRFTITSFTSQGASDRSAETPGVTSTQKASSRIATLVAVLSILIVVLSLGFMWEHRLRRSGDIKPGNSGQPFDLDGKPMSSSMPMAEIPGTFSEQRQLADPFSAPFSGGDNASISSASSASSDSEAEA